MPDSDPDMSSASAADLDPTGSQDHGNRVFIDAKGDLARTIDPLSVFGLLADNTRRRTFSAVELGARTPSAVARMIDVTERDAVEAIHKLVDSGLAYRDRDGYRIDVQMLREVAKAASAKPVTSGDEFSDLPGERASVLRNFVVDGRLRSMPAAAGKRQVVLEHIAMTFEPGTHYPEKQVNAILRAWWPDYAALRRYLVDAGLLSREAGEYWRSGGWVDMT